MPLLFIGKNFVVIDFFLQKMNEMLKIKKIIMCKCLMTYGYFFGLLKTISSA